jgi:hypothetical protein
MRLLLRLYDKVFAAGILETPLMEDVPADRDRTVRHTPRTLGKPWSFI